MSLINLRASDKQSKWEVSGSSPGDEFDFEFDLFLDHQTVKDLASYVTLISKVMNINTNKNHTYNHYSIINSFVIVVGAAIIQCIFPTDCVIKKGGTELAIGRYLPHRFQDKKRWILLNLYTCGVYNKQKPTQLGDILSFRSLVIPKVCYSEYTISLTILKA